MRWNCCFRVIYSASFPQLISRLLINKNIFTHCLNNAWGVHILTAHSSYTKYQFVWIGHIQVRMHNLCIWSLVDMLKMPKAFDKMAVSNIESEKILINAYLGPTWTCCINIFFAPEGFVLNTVNSLKGLGLKTTSL